MKLGYHSILIKMIIFSLLTFIILCNDLSAQNKIDAQQVNIPIFEYSKAIEDNSFLIEEAYNQEAGVVQHIFTGAQNFEPIMNWEFSFTQEWPLCGQTSQLSYTILYNSYNSGYIAGLGDLLINYRYQLFGKEDFAAVSPRISIIIPVGDKEKGFGNGTPGVQFNLPVSKRISDKFTLHLNAGFTLYPNYTSQNTLNQDVSHTLTYYNAGVSIVWLATENLNIMLELVSGNNNDVDINGDVSYYNEPVFNPGLRYAIDIGDLQIVPGLAFPITFSNDETTAGVFLYLSFEHPF